MKEYVGHPFPLGDQFSINAGVDNLPEDGETVMVNGDTVMSVPRPTGSFRYKLA
ncbi:MAG: hypothetical protein ACW987_20055 [Candidatus Thorarchaeota archaeon]|jgi:hypothetical protein